MGSSALSKYKSTLQPKEVQSIDTPEKVTPTTDFRREPYLLKGPIVQSIQKPKEGFFSTKDAGKKLLSGALQFSPYEMGKKAISAFKSVADFGKTIPEIPKKIGSFLKGETAQDLAPDLESALAKRPEVTTMREQVKSDFDLIKSGKLIKGIFSKGTTKSVRQAVPDIIKQKQEYKKSTTEEEKYLDALKQAKEMPFKTGFAEGMSLISPDFIAKKSKADMIQKFGETPFSVAQKTSPTAYAGGNVFGNITKYGGLYTTIGASIGSKLATKGAFAKATPLVQELLIEGIKDLAISTPLSVTEGLTSGLNGKDLADYIIKQMGIDLATNGVMYLGSKILKPLTNAVDTVKNSPEVVKAAQDSAKAIELKPPVDVGKMTIPELKSKEYSKVTKLSKALADKNIDIKTDVTYKKAETTYRSKILKDLQELKKAKLRPEYEKSANEILGIIDTKAKGQRADKVVSLIETEKYFDKLKLEDPSFAMNSKIEADIKRLNKLKIEDLTIDELRSFEDITNHIMHLNKFKNTLIGDQKVKKISEVTEQIIADNVKDIDYLPKRGKIGEAFDMYFKHGALDPDHIMRKLSKYNSDSPLYKAYQQLEVGNRTKLEFQQKAEAFINDIGVTEKQLGKQKQTFKMGEKSIVLTPQQKISLYMASKNSDNLKHLLEGGGRTKDMANTIKFTQDGIDDVIKSLTTQEKQLADGLSGYFDGMAKDAINKTSVELDGFEISKVNNYYPIVTDALYRSSDFPKYVGSSTLEGMGFLKQRAHAGNPIMIEDVFEVLHRNINKVSAYSGNAVPLRNMKAVFGNADVKRTLNTAYGDTVNGYTKDLFANLENGYVKNTISDKMAQKLITNSQKAVLGANPKVWVNQLASLPTAAAEIDVKYLVQGLTDKLPTKALMEKWSPEIWKRNKGFVTRETGELALEGVSSAFVKPIQMFDGMAIKKIWNGVEREISSTTKLLKGSDSFYEAVARRTEDIIHKTQPNYDALYRSRAGSQKGVVPRVITLFTTQRNKNYGLLYDAVATAKATGDFSKLKRTIPSLIASTLIIAGAKTGQNIIRGREDSFGKNAASSAVSNAYIMGSVFNKLIDGWDVDNMAEDSINDFLSSVTRITDNKGNKTFAGKAKDLTETLAKIGGIPVTNVRLVFEDALRATNPIAYYEYNKIWETPTRSALYTEFAASLGKKSDKFTRRLISDMKEDGVTPSHLKSSMTRKEIPLRDYEKYFRGLNNK